MLREGPAGIFPRSFQPGPFANNLGSFSNAFPLAETCALPSSARRGLPHGLQLGQGSLGPKRPRLGRQTSSEDLADLGY